ncbi:MAG TPA: HEAT repeat domain-containing protein [Vicinamibacterales bacterium]|nr:HEAT repeat domain-containing protein [Vicinamibacterales bacterium]
MTSRQVGILTTDTDLVVTSWDDALSAMTGIAAEDARGRPLDALIPDLEERGLLALIREPLRSGAPQVLAPALHRHLIPCRSSSGDVDRMQQRVVIGALRDDQRTVGLAITIEDVTARVERERELAKALSDADPVARRRAIDQLAAAEPVEGLGPLAGAIADDDWQVRRAAVHSLARHPDLALVEALVSALRDSHRNFSVLSSALQLLTLTGMDLTASLVGLLNDHDPDLRLQVALVLGQQPGPEAVDALLGALDDPDINVRFHVIEALGKLSPPAAVEPLAAIAEGHDFFLAFPALDALARISDPAVAPRLLPLLDDEMLGAQTADALAAVGDEDVVVPLVRALDREGAPVSNIVDALAAIERRYQARFGAGDHVQRLVRESTTPSAAQRLIDVAPRASGASLRSLVIVLGWLRGPAVERALTRLLGTAETHHESIEAVVRFGPAMVDRLVDQLRENDPDTRRAAVVALGRIGDRRAVPALLALLDGDLDLQVAIAGALAHIGDPQAFRPLLALLGAEHVAVRHAAIGALNSIGHPDMAAEIEPRLESPERNVRESAVKIAGYFGFGECADGLYRRCRDEDETVRATALEYVGYLDDPRVMPLLLDALAHDTPRCRCAAVQALAYVDQPGATAALLGGVADADSWVRYFSAISLGRRADLSTVPMLHQLLTADDAQHVRVAAADALGRLGGEAAADALEPFVADADTDVAIAAIHACGAVDVEAVGDALRHVLKSRDPRRRRAVIDALVQWGREPAVARLRATASTDADPAVARVATIALAALAAHGDDVAKAAVAALVDLAIEPAHGADAIGALARIPAPAIPLLGEFLESRDPHIRRAVAAALDGLSHPTASAYMRVALDDEDAVVRQKAIIALARVGAAGLARKFAEMARDDAAASVRHTASSALRRYGSRDAEVSDA